MPSSNPGIWSETFTIRSYDVDWRRRATLESVCRYFFDAAWNHAEALGVGFSHLAQQNRLWVLARLLIKVARPASWGETVRLTTWPRASESVLAMRDFELVDPAGTQLLGGSSSWLVLDATSRKPQRIDKLLTQIKTFPDRTALGQDPGKISGVTLENLSGSEAQARYSDLDMNQHVTSAKYITWLLDSYSLAFHRKHELRLLEINYVGETRAEEVVRIASQEKAPGQWLHSMKKLNNTEVCRARTEWQTRTELATPV